MLVDQMRTAIDTATTVAALDHVAKLVWQGIASDYLDDDHAHELLERLQKRRGPTRADQKPVGIPAGRISIFPPRRPQLSPRSPASLARRRHLAASGPMPPKLAANFTLSEMAVLMIVREEVRAKGCCDRSIAEMAARAGVGRTTVQNAIRMAAKLCLLIVQERRRDGKKNLTNVVRIVSKEWLAWNASKKADGSTMSGFKFLNPTDNEDKQKKGFSREGGRFGGRAEPYRRPPDAHRRAERAG